MKEKKQIFGFRKLSVGLASVALATTILGVTGNKQVQAADADANAVSAESAEKTDKADQTYTTATKTVTFKDSNTGETVGSAQKVTGVYNKETQQFDFPAVAAQVPEGYEATVIPASSAAGDTTDTVEVTKKKDTTPTTPSTDKPTRTIHYVGEDGKAVPGLSKSSDTQEGTKESDGSVKFTNPDLPYAEGYEADLGKIDNSSTADVTVVYRKLASKEDKTIYSSNPTTKPENDTDVKDEPGKTSHTYNFDFMLVDENGKLVYNDGKPVSPLDEQHITFDQNYKYSYDKNLEKTTYSNPTFENIVNGLKDLGVKIDSNNDAHKLYINGLPLKTVTINGDEYDVVYVTNEYHMGTDGKEGLKYTDVDTANIDDKTYYNFIKTHGYDPKNGDLGNKDTFNLVYNPSTSAAGYMPTIASMSNNTVIYLKVRPKSNTDTPTPEPTTSIVTESKTVTETIHYVYEDGTKAHDDFVAVPLIFTRTGVRDDSTGIVTWGSWSPAQTFQAVTSPTIDGYTPDKPVVDAVTVTGDSADQVFTVTYKKNTTPDTPETPDKPVTPNKDTDVPNKPSDNNTNTTTNTGNGETPATTVSEKSADQQLPQTGEKDSSLLSLIGLGMLAATGLYAGKRKRD